MIMSCFRFIILILLFVPSGSAEITCRNSLINNITVTTELQSDVLLPCYFKPNLFGSNKTADIAAVWSYRNITVEYLLEISLQGDVRSWNKRGGRIETFPKLSESGNFSILLHKVQQSDLGLYHCELHKGINCRIAYQKLHLRFKEPVAERFPPWLITVGTLGGGIVLLGLFIFCCLCVKCRRDTSSKLHLSDMMHTAVRHQLDDMIYTRVIYTALDNQSESESHLRN